MFKASLVRILKFSEKTFRCLILSKAITVTFEPICGSDASSQHFFTRVAFVGVELLILPCIDSWTDEYNDWSKFSNWGQKLRLNSYIETFFNKLQFFLASKFTSAAEGGGFYWLIHDSRWQNEIIVRVSGFQNPGVCRQAFPSFLPLPLPLLLLAPFSRCNSLLPNLTETLATLAIWSCLIVFDHVWSCLIKFEGHQTFDRKFKTCISLVLSGAPAAQRAAKRSPILITGKQRKPVSWFSHGYHG